MDQEQSRISTCENAVEIELAAHNTTDGKWQSTPLMLRGLKFVEVAPTPDINKWTADVDNTTKGQTYSFTPVNDQPKSYVSLIEPESSNVLQLYNPSNCQHRQFVAETARGEEGDILSSGSFYFRLASTDQGTGKYIGMRNYNKKNVLTLLPRQYANMWDVLLCTNKQK